MSRNREVAGAGAISRSLLSASTFRLPVLNRIDYDRAYPSVTALPSPMTRDRSEGCSASVLNDARNCNAGRFSVLIVNG
jgi:hypothetical protein